MKFNGCKEISEEEVLVLTTYQSFTNFLQKYLSVKKKMIQQ
jgi:hypothetical protein